MQNWREQGARINLRPTFINNLGASWQHNRQLIFDAGNEFHKFEVLDVKHTTMGLDRIEKAREGDNSKRIAKRVVGAVEMACYIEVYNGIDGSTVLEKDAEIKVPKIESKKSVRRRLQQQQNQ